MRFTPAKRLLFMAVITHLAFSSCAADDNLDVALRLKQWRKGVWISGTGTYTIFTDSFYFVVSYEGDSAAPNLYFGASQIRYTSQGMARYQVSRLREMPQGQRDYFKRMIFRPDSTIAPLQIDTTAFEPGVCHIKDGVIYDSVTEVTDEYILLATCNGDQEKIFANGVSVYLPAGGGGFYSFRVETF